MNRAARSAGSVWLVPGTDGSGSTGVPMGARSVVTPSGKVTSSRSGSTSMAALAVPPCVPSGCETGEWTSIRPPRSKNRSRTVAARGRLLAVAEFVEAFVTQTIRLHSASVWRSVGSAVAGRASENCGLAALWTVWLRSQAS